MMGEGSWGDGARNGTEGEDSSGAGGASRGREADGEVRAGECAVEPIGPLDEKEILGTQERFGKPDGGEGAAIGGAEPIGIYMEEVAVASVAERVPTDENEAGAGEAASDAERARESFHKDGFPGSEWAPKRNHGGVRE